MSDFWLWVGFWFVLVTSGVVGLWWSSRFPQQPRQHPWAECTCLWDFGGTLVEIDPECPIDGDNGSIFTWRH